MQYILDRPVPVRVKEVQNLTDLSFIKQCLLYQDRKASSSAYKIAKVLNLNLGAYITNINDLQMIIERLPSQQSFEVLNSVSVNMHTNRITEAVMAKHGE